MIGELLDRAIAPWAPKKALERMHARSVIMAYEAAKPSRTHKAIRETRSADAALQPALQSIREQIRALEENHDLVTGLFDRMDERVVGGPGIAVEPIPLRYDGTVHTELAAAIKAEWGEWSLKPEASGELTRPQVERLVCRTWLRDGEALAQMLQGNVPGYEHLTNVPFALELLEPDYLPLGYNDFSNGIVQGVERNAWRRVKAYHLLKQHPGSLGSLSLAQSTKRVPVEQMIHIAHRKRIGQNRGVPLLHSVLIRLADIKDYEESERVAARISAALVMYIKKGTPDDFVMPGTGQQKAQRSFNFAPGMVFDNLLPGEEVGTVESNRPNPFLEGFRNGQLKAIAAGARSTYSSVARSYDGTYSAQRQELVEGQQGYDLLQHEFIDYWCRPVYRAWLRMAVLSGRIKLPPDVNPLTLYGAFYQGPVMPWINPVHEATAWELLVKAGFADEAEVARSRQRNPSELKASRTAEIQQNREAGLVFSSDYYHTTYGVKHGNEPTDGNKEPANVDDSTRVGGDGKQSGE
ncbi:phage portal protein [Pseudomonas putida]|uniref:phage portal protein n=1 Tax=Pseudomonas putida TaxID=303 RepID=UPI00235C78F9|nr:phage portal protein [Pseudomonas putida]GLO23545.1 phage portal protein [Pseudomonas putida]HDS0969535.1 phage portal protein [Pseudomonas putida]